MYRKRKRNSSAAESQSSAAKSTRSSSCEEISKPPILKPEPNIPQMLELVTKNIPPNCLVCDSPIERNSVLFHCECLVVFCQTCAISQVAAQRDTYNRGLQCPYCRQPSDNIRCIAVCKAAESNLIERAFERYKIRTSRNDDGICKTLLQFMNDNYRGTLTIEEVEQADSRSDIAPSFRLELARLELLRELEGKQPKKNIFAGLPLGPLMHLSFTRNVVLEHALEIQNQQRRLWEAFMNSSPEAALAYLTNEVQKLDNKQQTTLTITPAKDDIEVEENNREEDAEDDEGEEDEVISDDSDVEVDNKKMPSSSRQVRSRRRSFDPMFSYYSNNNANRSKYSEGASCSSSARSTRMDNLKGGRQQSTENGIGSESKDERHDGSARLLKIGTTVRVQSDGVSGADDFMGIISSVTDTTAEVDITDSKGNVRRKTIPLSRIAADAIEASHASSSSKASSVKEERSRVSVQGDNSMLYCICQKPYKGPYIRCISGKGECNGLVHPSCFVELEGKFPEELAAIEQQGFICSSCVMKESTALKEKVTSKGSEESLDASTSSSGPSSSSLTSNFDPFATVGNPSIGQYSRMQLLHRDFNTKGASLLQQPRPQQPPPNRPAAAVPFPKRYPGDMQVDSSIPARYGTFPSYYNMAPHPQLIFDPYAHPVSAGYVSNILHNSLQSFPANPPESMHRGFVSSPILSQQAAQQASPHLQAVSPRSLPPTYADNFGVYSNPAPKMSSGFDPSLSSSLSIQQRIPSGLPVRGQANMYPNVVGTGYSSYMQPNMVISSFSNQYRGPDIYHSGQHDETAIDPRSHFVQKQQKKVTSCDVQVIRWMISTANVFPVLVNRPINNREVPTSAVTLLLRCGSSIGMQNSAHYLHASELMRRLHLLLDRVKLFDESSNEFIVKALEVVKLQEGHLDESETKRNVMEVKLMQLLNNAVSRYKVLGLQNPIFTLIMRALNWCQECFRLCSSQTNMGDSVRSSGEVSRLLRVSFDLEKLVDLVTRQKYPVADSGSLSERVLSDSSGITKKSDQGQSSSSSSSSSSTSSTPFVASPAISPRELISNINSAGLSDSPIDTIDNDKSTSSSASTTSHHLRALFHYLFKYWRKKIGYLDSSAKDETLSNTNNVN